MQREPEHSTDFWTSHLEALPPVLDLPVSKGRHQDQAYRAEELTAGLPLGVDLEQPVVLAALLVVLRRYSSQKDLLIGVDRDTLLEAPRGVPTWSQLVPLRVAVSGDPSFGDLIGRLQGEAEACRAHAQVPLGEIVDAVGAELAGSHHPVFQVAFTRGPAPLESWPPEPPGSTIRADLGVEVLDSVEASELRLVYNAELLDREAVSRFADHVVAAVEAGLADPRCPILSLPMMGEEEVEQIARGFNDTAIEFPRDLCLHQLFEQHCDAAPGSPAAICEDRELTYAELDAKSNKLANHLRGRGVGPNQLVGICVERSLDMVVGLMAIAKAGGAYMPLDPAYPEERLAWMVGDADLSVVLTLDRLTDRLPATAAEVIRLDSDWHRIAEASDSRPRSGVQPTDLAYVIYTSGSTGNPKGVVLDHRGRVNNFSDFNRRFSVGPGDRLIALSSLSFDMTAYDVFGTLAAGATIVMPPAHLQREPSYWAHLIKQHQVTIWHSAPAMLVMLVEGVEQRPELHPRSLRLCLLGGDWIPVELPDRLRALAGEMQVISLGGATEASMDSTIYEVHATDPEWTSIPYGAPMAGQLAYVLDERLRLQPVGVPGELYLGGIGVAWGYLERPELTAEKFVPNPYSGVPGDRMYRTGDLARFHEDGNLELLGRIDYQIKIRGHRIELGEIEATLKQHHEVGEAVVVAKGDRAGERKLIGYVVPALETDGDDPEEAGWDDEQVGEWEAVYDETYGQQAEQADPTFNIIGWNSSFTGLPIPDEEMREWVDTTVDRIRALEPKRVLEIGCGTGLMLFRVAPGCESYVGLDLSAVGLQTIERQLAERGLDQVVELRHQMADDLSGIEPRSVDVVILNSITQLFPSVGYLLTVLEGAVEAIKPGGFLFVGDNRSLELAEPLHTAIQLFQSPAGVPRKDLPERVRKSIEQEEQLLLDPAFFTALPSRIERLSTVAVQIKRGRHHNELTRFRYDVIATVEAADAEPERALRVEWLDDDLTLDGLATLLEGDPERLDVCGVPNARLAADLAAQEAIASGEGPATAGQIRDGLRDHTSSSAADPEDLWVLGEKAGYKVFIGYSSDRGPGSCDVIFRRGTSARPPAIPAAPPSVRPWAAYGNQPLKGRLNLRLPSRLRAHLDEHLPDYMVPTTIMLLERLPLSPNGKVDRKALPEPEQTRPELDAPLVPPRDSVERILTGIWEEILGLEQVGVHDGFLELGGHSLLATQVQSRILELFPVEVPLRHFFGALTVEGLAETVRKAAAETDFDIESAADLVLQYSDLSVEELETALGNEASKTTSSTISET